MARPVRKAQDTIRILDLDIQTWTYGNQERISCPICGFQFNEIFCKDGERYLVCARCEVITRHLVLAAGDQVEQDGGENV